jgi:ATP-dependent protease ClpP protease subunit
MAHSDSAFGVLRHGTWALFGDIDDESVFQAYRAIANTAANHHVLLMLNTDGGDVPLTCGLIHSIHKKFPVFETRAVGEVSSAGVHLMLAGNLRTALEPSGFYTHAICGMGEARPHSVDGYAKSIKTYDKWIAKLFAARTKRKDATFWVDFFSRDRYFDTKEAKRLGIIHEIL